MNLRPRNRMTSEVSTGSLNDIMFMLLLFFLIVSTMVNPSVIKLLLPKATGEQTVAKKMITLSVDADKQYAVDDQQVSFDQIEPTLKQKISTMQDPTIVLRVDESLQVQDLVDVLDIGARLQLRMNLAIRHP